MMLNNETVFGGRIPNSSYQGEVFLTISIFDWS